MLEYCIDRERRSVSKGLKTVLGAKVDVDSTEVKLLGADGGTGLELCLFLLSDHSAWLLSREACNEGEGDPPLYVNVNMFSGQLMNTWIDSLQAFFPGLQVFHNSVCLVKSLESVLPPLFFVWFQNVLWLLQIWAGHGTVCVHCSL